PLNITLKESNTSRTVGKCDKSLWTWCVEATLELHRVVFDLFSGERDPACARLMRLVLADCVGRVLQPRWGTKLVTQQELYTELVSLDPVRSNYWKHQMRVADNLLERRSFRTNFFFDKRAVAL
ncbi:hypothetical protein NECAME_17762, partial [Necator americanus]